jgi:hypothetical protein
LLTITEVGQLMGEQAAAQSRPAVGNEKACTWRSTAVSPTGSLLDLTVAPAPTSPTSTTLLPGDVPTEIRGADSATAGAQGSQANVSMIVDGYLARLVYAPSDHNAAAHLDALKDNASTVASRLAASG